MEKLSLILWRERELLETLLYRLEVEQLVLTSGRSSWLARATRDVEGVLETLRETEVLRAVAADEAAEQAGLSTHSSLRELADAAPEPWRSMLHEHRDAFASVTRRLTETADTNRDLITAGHRAARDIMMNLDDEPEGYGADGAALAAAPGSRMVDWSL